MAARLGELANHPCHPMPTCSGGATGAKMGPGGLQADGEPAGGGRSSAAIDSRSSDQPLPVRSDIFQIFGAQRGKHIPPTGSSRSQNHGSSVLDETSRSWVLTVPCMHTSSQIAERADHSTNRRMWLA